MKKYISIGIVVTIMLLVTALSISLNVIKRKNIYIYELENRKPEIKIVHKKDTIYDTITIRKPYKVTEKIIERIQTPNTDSLYITQKVYKDSTFMAVISGYKPNLDTIQIYNKTIKDTIIIDKAYYVKPEKYGLWIRLGKKEQRERFVGIGYILE